MQLVKYIRIHTNMANKSFLYLHFRDNWSVVTANLAYAEKYLEQTLSADCRFITTYLFEGNAKLDFICDRNMKNLMTIDQDAPWKLLKNVIEIPPVSF